MTEYTNAIKHFEKLYKLLNNLRESVDKEAYYYRKEETIGSAFNSFSDAIDDASRTARQYLRDLQSLNAHKTAIKPKRKTIKK